MDRLDQIEARLNNADAHDDFGSYSADMRYLLALARAGEKMANAAAAVDDEGDLVEGSKALHAALRAFRAAEKGAANEA